MIDHVWGEGCAMATGDGMGEWGVGENALRVVSE